MKKTNNQVRVTKLRWLLVAMALSAAVIGGVVIYSAPRSSAAAAAVGSGSSTNATASTPKASATANANKTNSKWISKSKAVEIADEVGETTQSTNSPGDTIEAEMTYAQAGADKNLEANNPKVAPNTEVWVVEVKDGYFGFYDPPAWLPNGIKPQQPKGYTVIIDATSGEPIDACGGNCGI